MKNKTRNEKFFTGKKITDAPKTTKNFITEKESKVNTLIINDERGGQRIDNFLRSKLKKIPKTHIYKILRSGEVRVNSRRVKPSYHLQTGDSIRIPPVHLATSEKIRPSEASMKLLENCVIYEDDDLLIVNKPSGMSSHGGSGINFGVIETLRASRDKKGSRLENLELVHRLDKGTSGCLIIAKKRSALRNLHEMLRNGKINKKYSLLVKGKWRGESRTVSLPLARNMLISGERLVTIDEERGKSTITKFIPKKIYQNASLLEAILFTGKTHQIRVHAAHLGHPLAGDEKYGYHEFNDFMRTKGLHRLFLHAFSLRFKSPNSDKMINVVAKLDDELQHVLDKL